MTKKKVGTSEYLNINHALPHRQFVPLQLIVIDITQLMIINLNVS